jgi:iron(III) transport system substrate-binding protein
MIFRFLNKASQLFVSSHFSIIAVALIGASAATAQELNVYSSRQEFLSRPFIERFEKEAGVRVNIVFIQRGMLERLKAEGVNSKADVVMTVDVAQLSAIADAGVLQPVASPVVAANVPAQYRGPDDIWIGLTTRARIIYTANDRVKPGEIATYEDLVDPKWKGRICTRSGYHDYNVSLLASIAAHRGEAAAEKWLAGLRANLARKPQGGDRDQILAVAQGICDVALGNTYYYALMTKDEKTRALAEKVALIFPNQGDRGTHVNISGIAITKAAKNLAIARKFVEYLSGDEAQALYAEQNNEYPVKPGIPVAGVVASWGPFKTDAKNLGEIARMVGPAVKIVDRVRYDE